MKSEIKRTPFAQTPITLLILFIFLLFGIWTLAKPNTLTTESPTARQAQADLLGLEGLERDIYIADTGNAYEEDNALASLTMGDYYAHRVSYPTGQFNPMWYVSAGEEHRAMAEGLPAGNLTTLTANSLAPLGLNLDPTQFTSLGPQPEFFGTYGRVAGRTNFIVSNPVDPTIAYIGSDGGGVWKTTNCCSPATTWQPMTDDPALNSIAIGHLELDPNDPDTIYAGTGDLRYGSFSFGSAGLLKSTDAGATWVVLGETEFNAIYNQPPGDYPQYQAIGKVKVDPRDSNNVVVGTKQGIFFSYDAGNTWSPPCFTNGFSGQRQDATGLILSDNGASTDIYAAVGTRGFPTAVQTDLGLTGANGVYHTTMPGAGCPAGWTLLNNGWPTGTGDGDPANDSVGRIDLAIAPNDPDTIYAQVASNVSSSSLLGVWRTTDGGATWTQRAIFPTDFLSCTNGQGQTWYNAGMTVDPNNADTLYLSMIDAYRSTDGGDTFTNTTCGYAGGNVHVDHHARTYVGGNSSTLLLGSDGGVWWSTNADTADPGNVNFIGLNDTLSTIEFYSGDITANFAYADVAGANGGAQDNGSMVTVWDNIPIGPAEWDLRTGGDGMYARIEPLQGQRWYQESQNGSMKVSLAGPYSTFVAASNGFGGDTLSFVMPYEIDKYDCDGEPECGHLIVGTTRVWEHVTGAQPSWAWYPNSPDLTKGTLGNRSFVNQLMYATSDNSMAIAGTNDGNVWFGFGLGQGTADTATWVDVTNGNAILPNRPIQDVVTHPAIPTTGYAAIGGFTNNTPTTPGHVYEVICNADCSTFNWTDKSGNLPNIPINSIIVNPRIPSQVFAGSDWGLYYTDDITVASPNWVKFTAGLPSVMIWDMSIDRGFTTLALFTRSRGAYAWPLPGPQATSAYTMTDSGNYDDTISYTVMVTNTGDVTDTFSVDLSNNLWITTASDTAVGPLAPGESGSITVDVLVPFVSVFSSDRVEVKFTADSTGGGWNITHLITVRDGLAFQQILPVIMRP